MNRPRLMEQVERAARLYDEEVAQRERGRAIEATPPFDVGSLAADYHFDLAKQAREERLELLRRIGLL